MRNKINKNNITYIFLFVVIGVISGYIFNYYVLSKTSNIENFNCSNIPPNPNRQSDLYVSQNITSVSDKMHVLSANTYESNENDAKFNEDGIMNLSNYYDHNKQQINLNIPPTNNKHESSYWNYNNDLIMNGNYFFNNVSGYEPNAIHPNNMDTPTNLLPVSCQEDLEHYPLTTKFL
jgi:hypothetical protein